MRVSHKGHKINVWFVAPVGYTFTITRKGFDVYIGSGDQDMCKSKEEAVGKAKEIIDTKLNGPRICKLYNDQEEFWIWTDADNVEINQLLMKYKPESGAFVQSEIVDYLNKNLTTGRAENRTKQEE